MKHPDEALVAEVRKRFQRSNPAWSDERFEAWLADATAHGGRLVLTLDGAMATYPRADASTGQPRPSKHHSRPTAAGDPE